MRTVSLSELFAAAESYELHTGQPSNLLRVLEDAMEDGQADSLTSSANEDELLAVFGL